MGRLDPKLHLQTPPFLRMGRSTPTIMGDVLIGLSPVLLVSLWRFGLASLLVLVATCAGAVLLEWITSADRRTMSDGTALLTGMILALTLPPSVPLWIAFLGGAVAIGLGKAVWGGLGQNLFNPALVGRAFLQAAFPTVMTTWVEPAKTTSDLGRVFSTHLAPPLLQAPVDAVTTATPLARMKFDGLSTDLLPMFLGDISGSLGETSALAALVGGAYMLWRRAFDWRIPVSILLTVVVVSGTFHVWSPSVYPTPWFMLMAGGLMFGAIYMATDPVTSPLAPRGAWWFGIGIGVLVVLIRLFGGLPEGVMYAILLMNAATPLIDRVTQPRPFGRRARA